MVFRPLTGKISPALPSAVDEGFRVFTHPLLSRVDIAARITRNAATPAIPLTVPWTAHSRGKLSTKALLLDDYGRLLLHNDWLLLLINALRDI
mgnify:CR=1 FL=1